MIMYKKKSIRLLEFYSLLLSVLMLFCFISINYADLNDPSLSIYYSFDNVGNKVIKDGSKYKNDGEVVGGAGPKSQLRMVFDYLSVVTLWTQYILSATIKDEDIVRFT